MRTAVLMVIFLGSTSVGIGQAPESTGFEITSRRAGTTVTSEVKKERTVFVVNCPSGIGGAEIRRQGKVWPDSVVLRLQLQGLEYFRVSNGKTQLEASVSVRDGKPVVRIWKDGNEDAPLDPKSRYWMEIHIPDRDREDKKPPLDGGSFEILLPKALFEGSPESITLDWIDFYR